MPEPNGRSGILASKGNSSSRTSTLLGGIPCATIVSIASAIFRQSSSATAPSARATRVA